MKIVPDHPKYFANLNKRGLDMHDLTVEFFAGSMVVPAKQGRWMAIGMLNGRAIAVVFATLGTEAIAPISMGPASAKERKLL